MRYSAKDIENVIYRYLPKEEGYASDVIKAMNYAFKAGGKRLRPMMMKLCFDMFAGTDFAESDRLDNTCDATGMKNSGIECFMAAIEMIHTYSLIHDDLPALDNDDLRRGMPTVHKAYGEDIAILAGDGLLNYAFETAAEAFAVRPGDVAVEKAYTVLASKPGIYGMIGGQTLDVVKTGRSVNRDELKYIYENKTSALIECAMMAGALLGGAKDEAVDTIRQVANCVGMAFQVQDDILDVEGDEAVLGKPVLSDEKNEKYTYVTIYGLDKAKAYVRAKSDEANSLLKGLEVSDEEARTELIELINLLVDRDR